MNILLCQIEYDTPNMANFKTLELHLFVPERLPDCTRKTLPKLQEFTMWLRVVNAKKMWDDSEGTNHSLPFFASTTLCPSVEIRPSSRARYFNISIKNFRKMMRRAMT